MKREIRFAISMLMICAMLFAAVPAMGARAEEETAPSEENWFVVREAGMMPAVPEDGKTYYIASNLGGTTCLLDASLQAVSLANAQAASQWKVTLDNSGKIGLAEVKNGSLLQVVYEPNGNYTLQMNTAKRSDFTFENGILCAETYGNNQTYYQYLKVDGTKWTVAVSSQPNPSLGSAIQFYSPIPEVKARLVSARPITVMNSSSAEEFMDAVKAKLAVCVSSDGSETQTDEFTLDAHEEFQPAARDRYLVDVKYCGVLLGTVEVNAVNALINGASISTEGDLLVNIYMLLSPNVLANPDAYAMTFSWADHSTVVPVSKAKEINGEYCFTAAVNAKEMTDEISYLFAAAGSTVVICGGEASVQQLLGIYRDGGYSEKLTGFAKAALDYGTCAQNYFAYKTDMPASDVDDVALSTVTVESLSSYIANNKLQAVKNQSEDFSGLTIKSASLILNSTTALRIYYTLDEGVNAEDYTFAADVPLSSGSNGSANFIQIDNIAAKDLDHTYTVTVTHKSGAALTFSYCPVNYLLLVLKNANTSPEMKSLAKSIFLYNQAANAYAGK